MGCQKKGLSPCNTKKKGGHHEGLKVHTHTSGSGPSNKSIYRGVVAGSKLAFLLAPLGGNPSALMQIFA